MIERAKPISSFELIDMNFGNKNNTDSGISVTNPKMKKDR